MNCVECYWEQLTCLSGAASFDISASSASTMYVGSECLVLCWLQLYVPLSHRLSYHLWNVMRLIFAM